ncbi:MAG TPA: iron ABC transporter permease [Deltaproteobacteria bacterium]|jgi:iron complex transport system permease protein|nr:iron ABC transporter permease [Deltaproteobacteria bacterium]|tara:strand:- start:843 stop:1904 length:1062 start_codon:yes stop_codon:yes gene_type:complete
MNELRTTYRTLVRKQLSKIGMTFLLLLLLIAFAGSLGVKNVSILQVFYIILDYLVSDEIFAKVSELDRRIVLYLRLPRIALGVVGGATLAIAGVVMQGIMRNPLVSPFTIGISPAAGFGAAIAVLLGLDLITGGSYWVVLCAFSSALICATMVLTISVFRGAQSTTLILAGIALTYFFGALINTTQFIATEEQLTVIVHWTFGSLNESKWEEVVIILMMLAGTLPILFRYAWCYNALNQGEEIATSLGYGIKSIRIATIVIAVLLTASVVSFTGVIGFVGLVAPHIARFIIGNDHRYLIPFAGIIGALLLVASDTIGRTLFSPAIIPVGIVVAYIGVPMFVHLIISKKQDYFS